MVAKIQIVILMGLATLLFALCVAGCGDGSSTAAPTDGDDTGFSACMDDGDCPNDQTCASAGICKPSTGTTCHADYECPEGQICSVSGLCYEDVCTSNNDCSGNAFCGTDGRCQAIPGQEDGDTTEEDIVEETGDPMIECPEEIAFGQVPIGESVRMAVVVKSIGEATLELTDIQIEEAEERNDFAFDNQPTFPEELPPGAERTYNLIFTPSAGYAANAAMKIASTATNQALCIIRLTSEYSGQTNLTLDPNDELLFGNVRVEDPGVTRTVKACNEGEGNKVITITTIDLASPMTAEHFDVEVMPHNPTRSEPLFLAAFNPDNPESGDNCADINITYQPTEATIYPEMHENRLLITHDADAVGGETTEGQTEIRMVGSAAEESLRVRPNPIDCGSVVVGETSVVPLSIQNLAGGDVTIESIELMGHHCAEFHFYPGEATFPYVLEADRMLADIGVGYEPANQWADEGCRLTITTDLEGAAKTTEVLIVGEGILANEKPVARIAREDNGASIEFPIDVPSEATENQRRISLWGDISFDPDEHYPLRYAWTLIRPESSEAILWPHDDGDELASDAPSLSFTVDASGLYTVELTVTDSEGLESDPKQVLVSYAGQEAINIDMNFSGSGPMNVDLVWVAPNGVRCSDSTMNMNRGCELGAYGTSYVANNTTRYDRGHRESIIHEGAPDGLYKIQAVFTENCTFDLVGFCLSPDTSDVEIKIYLNMAHEPEWIRTGTLVNEMDVLEWSIEKLNGQWREPNP